MAESVGKNFVVAILLVIFLGGLGIHRFYLGHKNTAIAMLVLGLLSPVTLGITAVVVGLWVLYDLICICIGRLRPADGSEYVK